MSAVEPSRYTRRSFVYRRLVEAGAKFTAIGDCAVAENFPGRGGLPERLALIDLSPLPRCGFKGPGVMEWIVARGMTAPENNDRVRIQNGGELLARLADTEILLLSPPAAPSQSAIMEADAPADAGCYSVPRRDSHAWFMLTGRFVRPCLEKLCGADLRPDRLTNLSARQTMVARLSTIVIRQDQDDTPAFHLLADSASALYLWDVLIDAMKEFHGGPAGLRAIKALEGSGR
jgi:sarcosine oxidase subunit gamma